MKLLIVGKTILTALFVGIVAVFSGVFIHELHALADIMGDRGFYQFDNEHHLVHGYDRRISMNLGSLNRGLQTYANAHGGRVPTFVDAAGLDKELFPKYIYDGKRLINPNSHRPLKPNPMLSGRTLASLIHPENVIAFYEADPPKAYPLVYYVTLDGTVHSVEAAQWSVAQAASTAALGAARG